MLLDSSHRHWAASFTVLLVVAATAYALYARSTLGGPSGGTGPGLVYGGVGLALMIYAGVIGARRKMPTWRVGRATTWMRGHLWLGLLSYPLIVFHSGFQLGGPLTTVLMALFTAVVLSGIYGLVLQQFLPRLMLVRLTLETVYEQIDAVVSQLRSEADELVTAVGGAMLVIPADPPRDRRGGGGLATGHAFPRPAVRSRPALMASSPEGTVLREIYLAEIRPYLARTIPRRSRLRPPFASATLFAGLRTRLPAALHDAISDLEAICDERRQLAQQKRLHHWLQCWLLVHAPLSMGLLLLALVHAVVSLRY